MKIGYSVVWYVEIRVGAKVGIGDSGGVDSDVGAEVGSGDGKLYE